MKKTEININITSKELKAICGEYTYDKEAHLLEEGDERPHLIKLALSQIDRADFIIWCLYMEFGSERKVANLLNCSRTPIHNCLERIKSKLKEKLKCL